MIVRQCACGATPRLGAGKLAGLPFIRLQCACGRKGARIICRERSQLFRARQAAVDGWNLAG